MTPSTDTSRRLLSLLSLLQSTRDWPGSVLAERLHVSERTVRRDVERLRDLGYRIDGTKGREGGYRLDAGAVVPPMLFDDEQVVAIAIALQTAGATGAGIGEPSARALSTLRQVLPSRLRARIDTVEVSAVGARADQARTEVLLAIGAAIRGHEELRFDYHSGRTDPVDATPRRTQPHHLVARHGRWYLVGWDSNSGDWRIYRADRMTPRVPTGPRFVPREVPGGDVGEFLSARFKGAEPAATGRSDRRTCETLSPRWQHGPRGPGVRKCVVRQRSVGALRPVSGVRMHTGWFQHPGVGVEAQNGSGESWDLTRSTTRTRGKAPVRSGWP
ncbi:helix-turn-helix transcriptional regulator [Gordonia jinghuaiqii]|uniref:helix-turn-helix transcriptional regulator n=1 Tax=Gordonia jinghuaiqii TaxID=2758710 RepID=UPI002948C405|nr:WYL domain-containing protein [Gordonia jinghuaiqii]